MDAAPTGALGRRWPLSGRVATALAVACVVIAVVVGALAAYVSRTHYVVPQPRLGGALAPSASAVRLVYAGRVAGVAIGEVQILGFGSLLAGIGAIASGTVAVITLQRRKRGLSEHP
jgi:hypothetical protein